MRTEIKEGTLGALHNGKLSFDAIEFIPSTQTFVLWHEGKEVISFASLGVINGNSYILSGISGEVPVEINDVP